MEITSTFIVLVPIIIGVVAVIRKVGLPTRYAPLVALLLGVGATAGLVGVFDFATILQGVVVGLSSAGLYSSVRTTANI